MNVGNYSLKPRLTQYTNNKKIVTSVKWALYLNLSHINLEHFFFNIFKYLW